MNFWGELKRKLANLTPEEEIHPHISDVVSKLPSVPDGHTRLYRVEDVPSGKQWPPEGHWLHTDPDFQKKQEARGRWYTPHLSEVQWYGQHANNNSIPSQMRYLDVPHDVAKSTTVSNIAGFPKGISSRPTRENFVPKEYKSKSQIVPGYDYKQLPGGDFEPHVKTANFDPKTFNPADYNTPLHPNKIPEYNAWRANLHPDLNNDHDYDLQGAFKSGFVPDENNHLPDKFKKPNHTTFSTESRYSTHKMPGGGPTPGGQWTKSPHPNVPNKDMWSFKPSKFNLKITPPEQMKEYFKRVEEPNGNKLELQGD